MGRSSKSKPPKDPYLFRLRREKRLGRWITYKMLIKKGAHSTKERVKRIRRHIPKIKKNNTVITQTNR